MMGKQWWWTAGYEESANFLVIRYNMGSLIVVSGDGTVVNRF